MKFIEVRDYAMMSKEASDILIKDIQKKPRLVLGLATGSTPLGLYKNLIQAYRQRKIDLSRTKTFNLDEYYPIKRVNRNSYFYFMVKHLFMYVNLQPKNVNFLRGDIEDFKAECNDYRKKLKKSPIDVMILGVGVNGHIAFNEPGSKINSDVRLVNLSSSTRRLNSRFFLFRKKVPSKALTMGVKNILSAKKIIVLASGKNKSKAVSELVKGKISSKFPITFLRKHKNLILIVDKGAGSLLS